MKKLPFFSISILVAIVILIFFGGFVYSADPYLLNKNAILLPPSMDHPFGTDRLGRDLLARVIKGGQNSLIIGVGSAVIASFIGLVAGVSAGYFRGFIDKSFVIIVDLFLTFPTFFLLLALVSYIQASALVLIIVISLTGWMGTARMIRSESFAIAKKPFTKILQIAKVPSYKIILKYFTPLIAPIFFISFTFGVGGAILAESGLSFLGLGVLPPEMSWGSILSEGKEVIDIAWWVSFFPGLMIFLVTLSLINISDYLQKLTNKKETML
ncbi:ABC transporter permease [Nitratiruptor sp. SB155-2]|uniref:ABC transporter permease n=1 Tax=Nitratiruptor sp. (strain SB155-2) TaxID=387092 RepID=UPI000158726B|nr:ABC transporter permease [Nitratiruptor sp. SB155-2]BAF70106.1 oligopeptide ABC transporter, permease [Nitratiruptor sp. SB155-2]